MAVYDQNLISQELQDIPYGNIRIVGKSSLNTDIFPQKINFQSKINGTGKATILPLFPGCFMTFFTFRATSLSGYHPAYEALIQIDFCQYGRLEWELEHSSHIYLGSGDLSVHRMDNCVHSTLCFPLGYYKGISLFIAPEYLEHTLSEYSLKKGISDLSWITDLCYDKNFSVFSGNEQIGHLFFGIDKISSKIQNDICKLKVLELFLYLSTLPDSHAKTPSSYSSEQTELIKKIHEYMMQNLGERITIDQLSKQFLVNTSTLKEVFKAVYGDSIAAHMKEHRLKEAARLLKDTDDSVSQIAKCVGYESQSKFSIAFKEIFHVSPSEYRKR